MNPKEEKKKTCQECWDTRKAKNSFDKKFKNIIYKDENLVGKKLKFPNTDFLKMERN